ncbi:MAG: hypothetical protein R3F65_27855 [bacterium]
MNRHTLQTILAAAAITAPLAGCGLSTEGENRLARFQWEDPSAPLGADLDHAIAEGTIARLDIQALDATAGLRVRGAKIDPPEIARIVATEINTLEIEGLTSGEAKLTIQTDNGEDVTTLRVARAAEIRVNAPLNHDKVLVGGIETLIIERRDITGQKLVGVAPADLEIKTPDAAEHVPGDDPAEFRLRYLSEGGKTIEIGDGQLSREIVGLDAIATFDFAANLDNANIDAGASQPGVIQALDAAGDMIGALEGLLQIESETPETCTATYTEQLYLPGLTIEGIAPGACVIKGTLGEHEGRLDILIK